MSFIIAIDGPAGAGKSTVARRLSNYLEATYLDTGAMYRSVAWLAIQRSVSVDDEAALVDLVRQTDIEFGQLTADGKQSLYLNGVDATAEIRTPEVSTLTSTIATLTGVRQVVVEAQREIASRAVRGVVLEGRDIGTVVFPDADLKIFLTASAEERANRRLAELKRNGADANFDQVLRDQQERDNRDQVRKNSPLVAASDAVVLSTDGKDIDAVVTEIVELWKDRRVASDSEAI